MNTRYKRFDLVSNQMSQQGKGIKSDFKVLASLSAWRHYLLRRKNIEKVTELKEEKFKSPVLDMYVRHEKCRYQAIIEIQRTGNGGNKNLEVRRSRQYEIYGKWLRSLEERKKTTE